MSTVRVSSIQNLNGVEVYTANAWVSFTGVGTVSIRSAGNVSSITDNGVGDYTVNFTNAMVDANYSSVISVGTYNSADVAIIGSTVPVAPTSNAFRFSVNNGNNGGARDSQYTSLAFFR